MLTFTINDKGGVELTFDGEDKRLAELNAGNGATLQSLQDARNEELLQGMEIIGE